MEEIDLSLEGILDNRWKLERTGNGEYKLSFYSIKGIPSKEETTDAIQKVMKTKNLESIYISGKNGDIKVERNAKASVTRDFKNAHKSIEDYPFGAEERLLNMEDRGII